MKASLFGNGKHEYKCAPRKLVVVLAYSVFFLTWNITHAAEQSGQAKATEDSSSESTPVKNDPESTNINIGKRPIAGVTMDTKAQTYVRSLPKTATVSAQKKEEIAKRKASEGPAEIQTLEEIKVRDRLDPEDYVAPKTAPMLVFREKLDAQRPMTPQEITKLALCFIKLCAVDTSKELKIDERNEARAKDPPSFIFR